MIDREDLQRRASAFGYEVKSLSSGDGFEVDFKDGGTNALMTDGVLADFVGQWERSSPGGEYGSSQASRL